MNALQTHFWAVRDYLAPVLRESKFKEHGRITPEEFVAAGDFLSYKFPTWSWSSAESSKYTRDFLPKDKQYLISKGVPCLRRVSQIEEVAWGKKAKKGSKEEIATGKDEKMLSFAEGGDETATGGEEDWLATHLGEDDDQAEPVGEIADIPDSEPPAGADSLTPGEEDALAKQVAGASFSDTPQANADNDDDGDVGDIPDMDDEDDADLMGGGGVIEADDPTTSLATASSSATAATTGDEPASSSNLLSVRTYDCMITYDKYYQTPRMWLLGYSPEGTPLKPVQIFQDISSDYAQKTVTIEPFPHKEGQLLASVHPCKHASVMKKVIERMDRGVKEEQKKASSGSGKAATETKTKKKKWGLPSAMKKTSTKQASEESPTAETPVSTSPGQGDQGDEENEGVVEGLRVDQYLLVFLKFMASIVPAIELDATQSF